MDTPSHDEDAIARAIGDEIEFWRKRRGLTRDQLGEQIGKSGNTVGRYERGDTMPDVSESWAIAKALGISLSSLIGRVEESVRLDAEADTYEPDEDTLRELRLATPVSEDEEAAAVESYLEEYRDAEAARRAALDPDDQ